MARYLINLKTKRWHDRMYWGERCQIDDAHAAGMTVVTWQETEEMTPADMRVYRYCRWCARQERYERGAVQA